MNLFKANQQWSTRPQDERFNSVEGAYQASLQYAQTAIEKADVQPATLRVEADKGEVVLIGKGNLPARLTHWSFGQLASRVGAPASYLRDLPATLAVQNLNHGLRQTYGTPDIPVDPLGKVNLLIHSNGSLLVRALTSEQYTRIWNHQLLGRMRDFEAYGWTTPVAFATTQAAHLTEPRESTIYVSDHDMFAFLVNNENRITEPGNPDGLGRGFIVENSEVGAKKLRITTFFYRFVCSNHIIWGAKDVSEIALRHVGKVQDRLGPMLDRLHVELTQYANESASEIEGKIKVAQNRIIDTDREKLIDLIFSRLRGQISRKQLNEAYLLVEQNPVDGDPHSYWGLAQGITRLAQQKKFADERTQLDKAAGALVDQAF